MFWCKKLHPCLVFVGQVCPTDKLLDSNAPFEQELNFDYFAKLPCLSSIKRSEVVKNCKNQTVHTVHVVCENVHKICIEIILVFYAKILVRSFIKMIYNLDIYKQKYYKIFKETYDSMILENGEEWEKKRKSYMTRQLIATTIIILIIASCFIGPYSMDLNAIREYIAYMHHPVSVLTLDTHLISKFIFFVTTRTALIFIVGCFIPDISKDLKNELLSTFGTTLENFKFEPVETDNIFSVDELKNSNLFADFNKIESDDNFIFNYKNKTIKVSEVSLTNEHQSYKDKTPLGIRCYFVFDGIVGQIKTDNLFKNLTLITTKNDNLINNKMPVTSIVNTLVIAFILAPILVFKLYPERVQNNFQILLFLISLIVIAIMFGGMFYIVKMLFEDTKNTKNIQRIDIGNDFSKYYDVYGENCVESRSLISKSLIIALNNLKNTFGTRNLKISFYKNNITFAIKTSFWNFYNTFELGSNFTSIYNYKFVEKFFNEIISLLIIVDILNDAKISQTNCY